jgi:hypothetical protein
MLLRITDRYSEGRGFAAGLLFKQKADLFFDDKMGKRESMRRKY